MLELEFEKIAALQPDLILGVMSGLTASDYAKLSKIAPTVAQHKDFEDWTIPYRPHTELVGAALGRPEAAAALITAMGQKFLYSMDWGTILSNNYAIENAVPRFAPAVGGDPSSNPNT